MLLAAILGVLAVFSAFLILFFSKHDIVKRFAKSSGVYVVPVFYLGAMAFFLGTFELNVVRSDAWNKGSLETSWIRLSYSFPFIGFFIVYISNPGRITRQTWQASYSMFPFDRVLYLPDTECRTCHFSKPARSKHCSTCNTCVAMQDHHCVWINNCIGLYNFRWFILFLLINLYVFAYGSVILVSVILPDFRTAWRDPQRRWYTALLRLQRVASCLLLLAILLLPIVAVFLSYHLQYVWAGVTTNEADKWMDIHDLIYTGSLYYAPGSNILLLKRKDGSWNRNLTAEEERFRSILRPAASEADIPNIYDNGLIANLKLAFQAEVLDYESKMV